MYAEGAEPMLDALRPSDGLPVEAVVNVLYTSKQTALVKGEQKVDLKRIRVLTLLHSLRKGELFPDWVDLQYFCLRFGFGIEEREGGHVLSHGAHLRVAEGSVADDGESGPPLSWEKGAR